jgi:hypothetical protein
VVGAGSWKRPVRNTGMHKGQSLVFLNLSMRNGGLTTNNFDVINELNE